jgi:hypothetical protein
MFLRNLPLAKKLPPVQGANTATQDDSFIGPTIWRLRPSKRVHGRRLDSGDSQRVDFARGAKPMRWLNICYFLSLLRTDL